MSQLFNELFNVNLNIVAAGPSRPCRAGGEELERWLRVAARHAGRLRKRVFLSHLYIKMITLPRRLGTNIGKALKRQTACSATKRFSSRWRI